MNAGVIPTEADVVVIGSGASGLAAALTAAEGGARVIVFEKQRTPGGTTNFFEGMFAVESDMQREQYIEYSRDQAFKNIMEYNHWRANPRLVRAIVNESSGTITWLRQQGVEFSGVTINMPNSPRTYHIVKGAGQAVIKTLVTQAKEKGVALQLGTPREADHQGRRAHYGCAGRGGFGRGKSGCESGRRCQRRVCE